MGPRPARARRLVPLALDVRVAGRQGHGAPRGRRRGPPRRGLRLRTTGPCACGASSRPSGNEQTETGTIAIVATGRETRRPRSSGTPAPRRRGRSVKAKARSPRSRVSPSTLCFATRRGGFHGWDLRAPPNKEAFRAPLPPRLGAVTCAAAGGHGFAPDDDGSAAFGAEGDARWVAFGTAAGVLGLLDVRFGVVAAAWQHPLGSATPVDAVAVAARRARRRRAAARVGGGGRGRDRALGRRRRDVPPRPEGGPREARATPWTPWTTPSSPATSPRSPSAGDWRPRRAPPPRATGRRTTKRPGPGPLLLLLRPAKACTARTSSGTRPPAWRARGACWRFHRAPC